MTKKISRPKTRLRKLFRRSYRKIPKNVASLVHDFTYKVLTPRAIQVQMDGNDYFFQYNFTLANLANHVELEALFDMYRINHASLQIIPKQNTMAYQASAGVVSGGSTVLSTDFGGTNLYGASFYGFPDIVTVIDYDDATIPTSLNEMLEYSTCRVTRSDKKHTRSLTPRIVIDSGSTGVSKSKQWIDCDRNSVPHYGVKCGICNVPSLSIAGTSNKPVIWFDLLATYSISFKNTR